MWALFSPLTLTQSPARSLALTIAYRHKWIFQYEYDMLCLGVFVCVFVWNWIHATHLISHNHLPIDSLSIRVLWAPCITKLEWHDLCVFLFFFRKRCYFNLVLFRWNERDRWIQFNTFEANLHWCDWRTTWVHTQHKLDEDFFFILFKAI